MAEESKNEVFSMEKIEIDTEEILLVQALKMAGVLESGGQIRFLLEDGMIKRNGVVETAKRRRLKPGDVIEVEGCGSFEIVRQGE